AYKRHPDSLGPMQALSSFSQSHRDAWGTLREQLPVQLGDVSEQVSSVFDAIDEDVAPLQSLLPQPPAREGEDSGRKGSGGSTPGHPSETGRSQTPGTGPGGTADDGGPGSQAPSRSADSGTENDGLRGGNTGGLLDPPTGSAARPARPAPGPGHRRRGRGLGRRTGTRFRTRSRTQHGRRGAPGPPLRRGIPGRAPPCGGS